jgi:hypothetical protein
MRKFGCNILAVIQQYDIIKESAVRGAMIGNSKMLSTVRLKTALHFPSSPLLNQAALLAYDFAFRDQLLRKRAQPIAAYVKVRMDRF